MPRLQRAVIGAQGMSLWISGIRLLCDSYRDCPMFMHQLACMLQGALEVMHEGGSQIKPRVLGATDAAHCKACA